MERFGHGEDAPLESRTKIVFTTTDDARNLARVPAGQHAEAEISTQGPTIPAVHMILLELQRRFGGFDNWVGAENLTSYASGSSPGRITVERNSP